MIRSRLGRGAAALAGALVLLAVPAGAQDDPEPPVTTTTFQISTPPPVSSVPPPTSTPSTTTPSTPSSVAVAVLPAQEVNDGELAHTGADPVSLAILGAALVAGGTLVGARRRRG